VRTESTVVVVDVGVSASRVVNGLISAYTDPDEVNAILITHEHSDHIGGARAVMNRLDGASVFASHGTWEAASAGIASARSPRLLVNENRKESFARGDRFTIGDIEVVAVPVSHDAASPVGYVFTSLRGEGVISIITDTGVFTEELASAAADADIFVIEANHDVNMLVRGRYPDFLKQRILSDAGHLSNEAAADAVMRVMALDRKPRCVLLAHLSAENNTPKAAEQTVNSLLAEDGYYSGRDLYVGTLPRDRMSRVFEI
jgi:phosphoribosyl 1,2-cyclic phosphodiesterase